MTIATFTPPIPPSPGTGAKPEVKVRSVSFGDGYTQEAPDGLNHIRQVATLTWECVTDVQAKAICDFFEARGGSEPFLYALSGDSTRQWKCKDWERKRATPNTVTATLREDFSIVP